MRIDEYVEKALKEREVERKALPEIPSKYWKYFVEFANEEHGGNWGAAFTDLIKLVLVSPEWMEQIQVLVSRLDKLEARLDTKEDSKKEEVIMTCSGKKISD